MNHLNRGVQRQLLLKLADAFPDPLGAPALGFDRFDPAWRVNMLYLAQHGLVDPMLVDFLSEGRTVHQGAITAKGLDFLQDDGGLGAILNVVTVRLEADTLRQLIAARVDASDASDEEKSRIKAWLKSAGSEVLSQATQRLVEAALDSGPAAVRLLAALAG